MWAKTGGDHLRGECSQWSEELEQSPEMSVSLAGSRNSREASTGGVGYARERIYEAVGGNRGATFRGACRHCRL